MGKITSKPNRWLSLEKIEVSKLTPKQGKYVTPVVCGSAVCTGADIKTSLPDTLSWCTVFNLDDIDTDLLGNICTHS